MAEKVKVIVLEHFGEYGPGEAELPQDRIEYLLKKNLIRLPGAEEASPAATEDVAVANSLKALGELLELPRAADESNSGYIDRVSEHLSGLLEETSDNEDKENDFQVELKTEIGKDAFQSLVDAELLTPEDIIDASDKTITDLNHIGDVTLQKIKGVARKFAA